MNYIKIRLAFNLESKIHFQNTLLCKANTIPIVRGYSLELFHKSKFPKGGDAAIAKERWRLWRQMWNPIQPCIHQPGFLSSFLLLLACLSLSLSPSCSHTPIGLFLYPFFIIFQTSMTQKTLIQSFARVIVPVTSIVTVNYTVNQSSWPHTVYWLHAASLLLLCPQLLLRPWSSHFWNKKKNQEKGAGVSESTAGRAFVFRTADLSSILSNPEHHQ